MLAPLARTFVEHQYPRGDQSPFVRSAGDRLEAEFVDPDARPPSPATAPAADDDTPRIEQIALDPRGADHEATCLKRHLDAHVAMYRAWCQHRGMKAEVLVDDDAGGKSPRFIMAVSGLAAHSLLAAENGLHVLEEPARAGRGFERVQVRVRVAPQPDVPPDDGPRGLRHQASAALEAAPSPGAPQIVRRYRLRPSPLVRDAVRGWRTGRIDRVLAGDFDLLAGAEEPTDQAARADDP